MSVSMDKKERAMGWCEICATQVLTKNGMGSRGFLKRAEVERKKEKTADASGGKPEKSGSTGDEEAQGQKPEKPPPKKKSKSDLDEMFSDG